MAKMGEGEYYYYLPAMFDEDFYVAQRDSPHPNYTVIAARVSQDNASLIVDALNFYQKYKRREADIISNMQYDGEEVGQT